MLVPVHGGSSFSMRRLALAVMAAPAIAVMGWMVPANAVPITYTFVASGSGVLNGKAFTDASVTFEFAADTANVVPTSFNAINPSDPTTPPILAQPGTATVLVNGNSDIVTAGPAPDEPPVPAFAQSVWLGIAPTLGVVGLFGNRDVGMILMADPLLTSYDLTTAIGPITAAGTGFESVYDAQNSDSWFVTASGGSFYWTAIPTTVTFAATVAVPEPSSIALAAVGLFVLVLRRRFVANAAV